MDKKYQEYLQSDEWKEKREERLKQIQETKDRIFNK